MNSKICLLALMLSVVLPYALLRADDAQASKESRLRDALQNAYGLLRTAQDQNATLQAAQAESEKEKDALNQQVQTTTDKLKAEETKSALDRQTAQAQIDQLKSQIIDLQRKIDEDETRNVALYQVANDILTRYEKFSLGEALEAKEPFTGLMRTKLENLVQGYQDKILAQKPGAPFPAAPTPTTNTASAQKPAATP